MFTTKTKGSVLLSVLLVLSLMMTLGLLIFHYAVSQKSVVWEYYKATACTYAASHLIKPGPAREVQTLKVPHVGSVQVIIERTPLVQEEGERLVMRIMHGTQMIAQDTFLVR